MSVAKANLEIQQGSDYAATVFVMLSDGTPANITGWTAKAQLRNGTADCSPEVVYEIPCIVQAPDKVALGIPHSVTQTLKGRYSWDLDLTSPANAIMTVLAGAAIVTPEVTR